MRSAFLVEVNAQYLKFTLDAIRTKALNERG